MHCHVTFQINIARVTLILVTNRTWKKIQWSYKRACPTAAEKTLSAVFYSTLTN